MRSSHQENHKVRISIDGQQVDEANQFKYLGRLFQQMVLWDWDTS